MEEDERDEWVMVYHYNGDVTSLPPIVPRTPKKTILYRLVPLMVFLVQKSLW